MEMYISALVLSTTSHPNLKIYSAPVPNLKKSILYAHAAIHTHTPTTVHMHLLTIMT